eukprot:gene1165-930_t
MDALDRREIRLEVDHAWGSYGWTGVRDCVAFGDEVGHFLAMPVGTQVAFRHIDTHDMWFVNESEKVTGITAMTISQNKDYMAVSETLANTTNLQVTIYDLRQKVGVKPYRKMELHSVEGAVRSMNFSSDNKVLIVSGGAHVDAASVVLLDVEKGRPIYDLQIPTTATRVSFSPLDNRQRQFLVSGNFMFRAYKGDQKPTALPLFADLPEQNLNFTDHDWILPADGTVVTTTKDNGVYVLNCESLTSGLHIAEPFDEKGVESHCVRFFSQGFVVGGSHGFISLFERVDTGMDSAQNMATGRVSEFTLMRTLFVGRRSTIYCLDIADSEESMCMSFRNADVGLLSMSHLFVNKDKKEVTADIVANGFHCGPVTGLDIALQRPIIASCCRKDSSVRIWNYNTKQCELARVFLGDEPITVGLHPLGYYLAIGFADKFRVFHILMNELQLFREFSIRGVRVLKFSHGGHLLAAANGKLVLIFQSSTLKRVATLRGHQSAVQGIAFDGNDTTMATCGADGVVYEWSTTTWTRMRDSTQRGSEFNCVSYDSSRRIVAGGCNPESQGTFLCEIGATDLAMPSNTPAAAKNFDLKQESIHTIHHPAYDNTIMFAGTGMGVLRVCPQPADHIVFQEFGLHMGAMKHICMSTDGKTLVTAGDDGAIFVVNVIGLNNRDFSDRDGGTEPLDQKMSEVVMIKKGEINQQLERVEDLQVKLDNYKNDSQRKIEKVREELISVAKKDKEEDKRQIVDLQERYATLQQSESAKAKEHQRMVKSMEHAHVAAAEQLESLYEKKITLEVGKIKELEAEKAKLETDAGKIRAEMLSKFEQQKSGLVSEFEREKTEKEKELARQKDILSFNKKKYEGAVQQELAERELEIDNLHKQHHEELSASRQVSHQLKREQDSLLRGLDLMEKDKEKVHKEQAEASQIISDLRSKQDDLTRTVESMKREKKERESILKENQKKIAEYKSKVSTLKKF